MLDTKETKYNIVLIPNSNDIGQVLISLAKEISIKNGLNPDYLLKNTEQMGIPHISVIQFSIEKNSLSPNMFKGNNSVNLELVWKHVIEAWQEILSENGNLMELVCNLSSTINYKHDTQGEFAGISWSEIIINKIENPLIQKFHDKLCERLTPMGIKCLNASGERYNPHFTLFNISTDLLEQSNPIREISDSYQTILKNFSISPALGVANNKWELTAKLKEEKPVAITYAHKTCNNF